MQLLPHPNSPPACGSIRVTAEARLRRDRLEFEYRVQGDVARISWPRVADPGRTDGLWRHTCFEAFLAAPGGDAYVELNFSPSGAWAAYALAGYRAELRPLALVGPPRLALEVDAAGAALRADTELAAVLAPLPPAGPGAPWLELALCAVIEDAAGGRSYWALHHGAAQPDFHRRDGFSLRIGRDPQ